MGEKSRETLKLQFDKQLRLELHGARITSDAGLLVCRELDGALEITEISPTCLQETQGDRKVRFSSRPFAKIGYPDYQQDAQTEKVASTSLSVIA